MPTLSLEDLTPHNFPGPWNHEILANLLGFLTQSWLGLTWNPLGPLASKRQISKDAYGNIIDVSLVKILAIRSVLAYHGPRIQKAFWSDIIKSEENV